MAKKIYLASSSPRRIEILRELKLNFEVVPYSFRETFKSRSEDPVFLACDLAKKKLESVLFEREEDGVTISADTIVFQGDRIFGKPANKNEAKDFLEFFSENTHNVITAICMKKNDGSKMVLSYSVTSVKFSKIDEEIMDWYIKSGEWKDKAGGYAIQGKASLFIEGIEGCYYNVVGFPINLFLKMVKNLGYSFFDFKKEDEI